MKADLLARLFVFGSLCEQSACARDEIRGEITSPGGHTNHRKLNSYTEAPSHRVGRPFQNRRSNEADLRTREYLTTAEVERLLKATKGNRWSHRDSTMILVAYRHGLRARRFKNFWRDYHPLRLTAGRHRVS